MWGAEGGKARGAGWVEGPVWGEEAKKGPRAVLGGMGTWQRVSMKGEGRQGVRQAWGAKLGVAGNGESLGAGLVTTAVVRSRVSEFRGCR